MNFAIFYDEKGIRYINTVFDVDSILMHLTVLWRCTDCRFHLGVYQMIKDAGSSYEYLFPEEVLFLDGKESVMCANCIERREVSYVESLDIERVPLFINHRWVTQRGHEKYLQIWKDYGDKVRPGGNLKPFSYSESYRLDEGAAYDA